MSKNRTDQQIHVVKEYKSNGDENDGTLSMVCEAGTSVLDIEKDLSFRSKDIKCQITIIKWIGVLIIAMTCAVPGFVMLSEQDFSSYRHHNSIMLDFNQTACVLVKKIYLQENLFVTMCRQKKSFFVNIRKFINGTVSTGVSFNSQQWQQLKRFTDAAISEN